MMHLMMRNRFALGKFVAMMLVVVFLVSIPTAYIGTAVSNQKQAAIREAMDEVLARVKEKGVFTLEDYEELKDILNSAGGAGKYDLDINIVRPHEHQHVDDITAWLPNVRTDMPLAPGDGVHVHSEDCFAHKPDGTRVDNYLRCGPSDDEKGEVDGKIYHLCLDGRYIISDISITLPESLLIRESDYPDGVFTTDPQTGAKTTKLHSGTYTITYENGVTQEFDSEEELASGKKFGLELYCEGTIETEDEASSGTSYRYKFPADTKVHLYGYSDDTNKTAFFKPGRNPEAGDDDFWVGGVNIELYKTYKCPRCLLYYIPDDNLVETVVDGETVYVEKCPYCSVVYSSYESNYDDFSSDETPTIYVRHDSQTLPSTGFELKGIHKDGTEEKILGWRYDAGKYRTSTGEFDIDITFHEEVTLNNKLTDAHGVPHVHVVINDFEKTLHINKCLCVCNNSGNHPDGKPLYYMYDSTEGGLGAECPYCSRLPQKLDLGHTGVIEAPYPGWTALNEVLTNVHLDTGLGEVALPYISGSASVSKGWTFKPATAEELAANNIANTTTRTWYHIAAWDYFTYKAYDPETKTFWDETADDNNFDAFVEVTNELKKCTVCGQLHELNDDGTDPGCPYCKKKILGIKVYEKGTDTRPAAYTVADYYWGADPAGIAAAFDVIAEYADGHTENISETHPEWLELVRPSNTGDSLVPVEIQSGKQTVTIALTGKNGGTTMLADTSVGVYTYYPNAENPTSIVYRTVTVINHKASDTATVTQRVYRCPNEIPEEICGEAVPEIFYEDGYHYILGDENGVCPEECPTCKCLVVGVECTIDPMEYHVSEYGWDDVANTFLYGHNYFKAKTLDGQYHDLVPTLTDVDSFGYLSSVGVDPEYLYYYPDTRLIEYTPAPGKHTAKITLNHPYLLMKRPDEPYTDYFIGRSSIFYDSKGNKYYSSMIQWMPVTFEIEIFQDVCHCDTCDRYYHTDEDGNDPGCPFCGHSVVSISADPEIYLVTDLTQEYDLPSIFEITVTYEDGTTATTYTDDDGEHSISSACSFTPHEDNPHKYTVKYSETLAFTPCDKYGVALEGESIETSAECEVEIMTNVVQCEVCGHYYLGGPDKTCPYCAVKIESIESDVDSISCTVADLNNLAGFFKVYGVHPSKVEEPSPRYPEGRILGGEKTEIPSDKLTLKYTPGQLAVTYTYSAVADCLTAQGAPKPVTINDTRTLTIAVSLSGKVECPRCHYFYDLGADAAKYTEEYDIQGHCPYCDYIFYGADGSHLNGFSTVQLNSYDVTSGEDMIEPGTAKIPSTKGTQKAPGTYAVIAKGTTIGQLLEAAAVEMYTNPGHMLGIQTGPVSWATGAVTLTVSADAPLNTYNSELTGYQTLTARYTATFRAYTSATAVEPTEITQTCDVTLRLDVYDTCRTCGRMFCSRTGHGKCPHCSLDHITVTPGELSEELGILKDIRPYIAVVATFADGHTEAITSDENTAAHDYTDNFDAGKRGTQNVTISLTDTFDVTKTANVSVTLSGYWVCPICLKKYPLNSDGTNPVCEECKGTYVQLTAEPALIKKEWNSGMSSDDIKEWLTVKAKTRDGVWHDLTASDYGTDFMPSNGLGDRAVTVKATDGYGNTVTAYVTVSLYKKYKCDICGHEYDAATDGSDPGCPVCPTFVTGYEAGLNKTAYNLDEAPDLYFRCVYRDGHKEDKLANTTNNFDSRTAGERELTFSYLGTSVPGGTYKVVNNYLVICPVCGTENDTRVTGYDVNVKGYCPSCEYDIIRLEARPSASWLVPGTANRVYYGSEPDIIAEFVARNGTRTQVQSYEISGFDPYKLSTTQTITVKAFGYTGYMDVLVIKRGSAEDVIEVHPGAVITIDGVGYAVCPICGQYFRADLPTCPYCDFAAKYSAFIDDPDSNPGFRLKAGSAEYEAFSNVINGDSGLIVLDEILDRLYELPGIIEQVKAVSDPVAKADLLGLTGEDRDEYLNAYAELAALEALKAADPAYVYSDGELGQMAYLNGIIDLYESPGYVLEENDIVVVTIRKLRPNVFDYISNLFSENYEATYFTASAVISKRY